MYAESLGNECFLICAVYLVVFNQGKVRSYLAAGGGI